MVCLAAQFSTWYGACMLKTLAETFILTTNSICKNLLCFPITHKVKSKLLNQHSHIYNIASYLLPNIVFHYVPLIRSSVIVFNHLFNKYLFKHIQHSRSGSRPCMHIKDEYARLVIFSQIYHELYFFFTLLMSSPLYGIPFHSFLNSKLKFILYYSQITFSVELTLNSLATFLLLFGGPTVLY